MDLHQANDLFVVLSDSALRRLALQQADIGQQRWIKLPRPGDPLPSTKAVPVSGSATPLTPYAPVAVAVAVGGNPDDRDLTWSWRTRRGGALGGPNGLTDGMPGHQADLTTGEVGVFVISDPDTPVATHPVGNESYTYTDAQRQADFGGAPPLHIKLAVRQDAATAGVVGRWSAFVDATYDDDRAYGVAALGMSPVGAWWLDEIAGTAASAAVGPDGAYSGSLALAQTGIGGYNSVRFTGGVLHVTGLGLPVFANTAVTFCCAFRINAWANAWGIITAIGTNGAGTVLKLVRYGSTGNLAISTSGGCDVAAFTPTLGQWYFAAVEAAGDVFTLYINGTAVATVTTCSTDITTDLVTFGRGDNASYEDVDIAVPTVFDRLLTAQEHADLPAALGL